MKYLYFIATFFFIQATSAHEIIVKNVKVSITADSAAMAREQALEKAHNLAFQKLLEENFPEKIASLPPPNTLLNMVTGFSIDREKTTPKSYTASLTFQFDKTQVHNWIHQGQASSSQPSVFQKTVIKEKPLKIAASYSTLPEWQHIKRTLETYPGVQKITFISLTSGNANMEVDFVGDIGKLQQHFHQQGWLLTPQRDIWIISSDTKPAH